MRGHLGAFGASCSYVLARLAAARSCACWGNAKPNTRLLGLLVGALPAICYRCLRAISLLITEASRGRRSRLRPKTAHCTIVSARRRPRASINAFFLQIRTVRLRNGVHQTPIIVLRPAVQSPLCLASRNRRDQSRSMRVRRATSIRVISSRP